MVKKVTAIADYVVATQKVQMAQFKLCSLVSPCC